MKNLIFICTFFLLFTHASNAQIKKYCYTTISGKYVVSLNDDETKKVIYQLFDNSGILQKTMQGNWSMRDEGLYGPAYKITVAWTGINSGMQELKFVAQFDGNGNLQAIIDSQNRTWNSCR